MSGNRSTSVGTDSTDASNILSFITSFCGICLPTLVEQFPQIVLILSKEAENFKKCHYK